MLGYTYLIGDPAIRDKVHKVTDTINFWGYCLDKVLAAIGAVSLLVIINLI